MDAESEARQYREVAARMESVINRHMLEAFGEIRERFDATPISVRVDVVQQMNLHSGLYLGCSVSLGDEQ